MNARDWNIRYPIGTPVIYTGDDDEERRTLTRSTAWTLSSGLVVVRVDGYAGFVNVNRLRAITTKELRSWNE